MKLKIIVGVTSILPLLVGAINLPEKMPNKDSVRTYIQAMAEKCNAAIDEELISKHSKNIFMLSAFANAVDSDDAMKVKFQSDFTQFYIQNTNCAKPSVTAYQSLSDSGLHDTYPNIMSHLVLVAPSYICKAVNEQQAVGESYACE